jgi:hypothetical protein
MRKTVAALLVCCLLLSFSPMAMAESLIGKEQEALVYIDGLLTCRGYNSPQGAMLRLEDMCSFFGVEAGGSYDEAS